jgi:peptidoglycan/xylan/chitin deacetylase (PgdA/CDA1 family)
VSIASRTLAQIRRRRSVVLGYHGVDDVRRRDDLSRLILSPDHFRAQIELLLNADFRFLTMVELARLANGSTPPPGFAAITFDDGMRNNHEVALPILREYGIVATVYVTIGFIDGTSPWVASGAAGAMLTHEQLRELHYAGWELGAHTMSHPDLATMGYEDCLREIRDSRIALEQISGAPVHTFAYPFGRYGSAAIAAARDSGVLAAVTTGSGSWAPFEVTRAMISAADPMPVILLKLTDRYEPLLQNPPMRAVRAASKQARGRLQRRSSASASA